MPGRDLEAAVSGTLTHLLQAPFSIAQLIPVWRRCREGSPRVARPRPSPHPRSATRPRPWNSGPPRRQVSALVSSRAVQI
jgi:hypothetical protein